VNRTWDDVHRLPLKPARLETTDRLAIIVEGSENPLVGYTARNVMHFLGPTWALRIYHGKDNLHALRSALGADETSAISFVPVSSFGVSELSWQSYNSMILNPDFWRGIDQQHVLIFHTDALMLRHDDLSRWLRYDFVGSPWSWCLEAWCRGGGNGGMSLRSKKAMLEITSRVNYVMAEDQLFTRELFSHNGALPSLEEAAAFSIETVVHLDVKPAATHAFWKYNDPKATFELLNNIDYRTRA